MNHFASWLLWPTVAVAIGYALAILVGYSGGVPILDKLLDRFAGFTEERSRRLFDRDENGGTLAGVFALIFTFICIFLIPIALIFLLYWWTPIAGVIVEALLCWQFISTRLVRTTAIRIFHAIKRKDMRSARRVASSFEDGMDNADEESIIDASVNYNAETTPAASVAPILYMLIGGAALGAFYRTLKMLSLRLSFDENDADIGRPVAAAEFALDFIPARLSALLMLVGGFILGFDVKNARQTLNTDRKKGGANIGWPRACLAGLLNIRLNGSGAIGAVGEPTRPIENEDIMRSMRLHMETSIVTVIGFSLVRLGLFFASVL
ncbi:MAG: cobalamin biosynthesis protein [Clostridia bacterium]|nr:cobalamin biosynthesis protein [Clostridia bacterium]